MNRDRILTCTALAFACVCTYSMGWTAVREHKTVTQQAQAVHACKSILQPIEMLVHPPKGSINIEKRPTWGHPMVLHPGQLNV